MQPLELPGKVLDDAIGGTKTMVVVIIGVKRNIPIGSLIGWLHIGPDLIIPTRYMYGVGAISINGRMVDNVLAVA